MAGAIELLSGEIDLATVDATRARLRAAVDANPGEVIKVDMTDVSFIDSTGLGMLVGVHRYARQSGGLVQVINTQNHIAKVFEITGLDKVFS